MLGSEEGMCDLRQLRCRWYVILYQTNHGILYIHEDNVADRVIAWTGGMCYKHHLMALLICPHIMVYTYVYSAWSL